MRVKIRLVSTSGSGHFYTTTKNKTSKSLELKKFDPTMRKYFIYKEKKIT